MSATLVVGALVIGYYGVRIVLRRVFSALDNVPGPPRTSIVTGNLAQFHDPDDWAFQKQLEENYGGVVRIHGLLGDRELYVFDPTALHNILVQEPDVYEQPPKFLALDCLMWGKGVFSTGLDEHRKYRKIMMPAFSTANLRGMIPLFYDVARKARDGLIAPNVKSTSQTLELNSVFRRTALELIGRTGIGYSFDRMLPGEEQTDPYAESLRSLFPTAFKMQLLIPLLPLLVNNFPRRGMVRDRKAAIESGKLEVDDGKDIMSLLVKQNASADSGMHLTDAELVGCTSFVLTDHVAATDTTSSSMNRLFHVLALYPDVQEKLRAEILGLPEQLDHDTLVGLPYLDAVVREVLRLAMTDGVLPLSTPITGVDGKVMNSIPVPKGTQIYIAISAANHNKDIWGEDVLEFRPERVGYDEAVGIYGNTLTFLGGGRSCIGVKFAQLEMKVTACVLLRAFRFSSPDPRIKWRKPGIMPSPFVDNEPSLPIFVERLKA
ncbi:cytochrome P450 [Mycena leptocephala]|nr:cytochrome P450 [Mycena leptocephala]